MVFIGCVLYTPCHIVSCIRLYLLICILMVVVRLRQVYRDYLMLNFDVLAVLSNLEGRFELKFKYE